MRITVLNIGKTQESFLKEGLSFYEERIRHYVSFEMVFLNPPRLSRNTPKIVQKEAEGKIILSALSSVDFPVLLDERGKNLTSQGFASYLQHTMNRGTRCLGFVTGGPYGFSEEVYRAVPERISLSEMTFSHQLVRLVLLEQLYRGFTIIKGESYHHA
jgi:23S rRNA (pseudouridine1915-N3)-methyltransferase